ncbi:MAG: alpha/beta hydrolase, partial [Candidatus Woesearchaeota archaeon]
SACDLHYTLPLFEQFNLSLLFVEYQGYAADTQRSSAEGILANVDAVISYLQAQGYSTIVVYGQSLGVGPASYHAAQDNIDGLILVSGFSSFADVAKEIYWMVPVDLLLTEQYLPAHWLSNSTASLLLIHGSNDTVISARHSSRLYHQLTSSKKKLVIVEGYGHHDLWSSEVFIMSLSQFLSSLLVEAE